MSRGWRGGLADGTVCGQGSTMQNTAAIRQWLPKLVEQYGIRSVADAGAGDMHWIKRVDWAVDYRPFDLIPRSHEVQKLDITREVLPEADAILCRMVLNHLIDDDDTTRIEQALRNFKQAGRYLLATHFVGGGVCRDRQFERVDLVPYLGDPLEMCCDGHEDNCRLALWKL